MNPLFRFLSGFLCSSRSSGPRSGLFVIPSPGLFLRRSLRCLALACFVLQGSAAEKLEPVDKAWFEEHYTKFEFKIPMRDGVRLHTALFAPKDSSTNYPIWLTRTPYGVGPYGVDAYPDPSRNLRLYAREKFIFAAQDVRGRNGSEGEFMHVRPIKPSRSGPRDADESTDTWDTIDWLVKNIPNNNGRVGLSGISYPGFYAASGAIDGHPALKAVSPQAPIADWFIGDDFRHNGALYLPHAFDFLSRFEQKLEKPIRDRAKPFDYETPDGYAFYRDLGALSNADTRYFKGKIPFWNELLEHHTYDAFWQARNLRPHLRKIRAAVLTVGGWFDAEDLFGALAVYQSIERMNPGITNMLVMGPWAHGQWHADDGHKLGHVNFRSRTSEFFRQQIELPFFVHHLKGGPRPDLPEAYVFETGTCQWRRFDKWPPAKAREQTLFFQEEGRLGSKAPAAKDAAYDDYVSDPRKPVPFIPNIAVAMTREHMVDDQRFAASRPDVLVYQTETLDEDVTLAGPVHVSLHVTTTGTDSDWVVKLIDVYSGDYPNPDPNPAGVQMGGYQQLVRGEPMRGRFRNSYEKPEPFEPGKVSKVEWVMPDICHTFRRGHRIMVQVQSSWFPLVDLNPQTFVTIPNAEPKDFRSALQQVHRSAANPSSIRVRMVR